MLTKLPYFRCNVGMTTLLVASEWYASIAVPFLLAGSISAIATNITDLFNVCDDLLRVQWLARERIFE
jgi:hypothetical protein